jgi:hypothetical protein
MSMTDVSPNNTNPACVVWNVKYRRNKSDAAELDVLDVNDIYQSKFHKPSLRGFEYKITTNLIARRGTGC